MSGMIRHFIAAVLGVVIASGTALAAGEPMAQQVMAEMNLARTEPQKYAGHLRQFRKQYEGKGYWVPGSFALVMTQEGVPATAGSPTIPLTLFTQKSIAIPSVFNNFCTASTA